MRFIRYGLLAGLCVVVLSGCSSPSMKGSPFYTGVYEVERKMPAKDRVAAFPILYYNDPVLEVLCLFESTPDHLAVRPVYSVYNRDTDHPVHNVLWPIGRFDPANEDYRIFPVYWGDEYFNVFPLYWHEGDPFSGVGHNVLFPFWIWDRNDAGHSLHVFWPLYTKHHYPDHQAWRLWPLYGTDTRGDRNYRYYAWPFIHTYSNPERSGHMAIPLYFYENSGERTTFVSLPYSRSRSEEPGARSWDFALPLCYRQWKGDAFSWAVPPALSWGKRDGAVSDNWYALGLGRWLTSPERSSSHVIPLYFYNRDPESQSLYTLPWWSKSYADGTGWHALVPLYYRGRQKGTSFFYSLPWWSQTYDDGSGWNALVPLYYRSRYGDETTFFTLPWWSKSYGDGSSWQALLPFYLRSQSEDSSAFYSLLWLAEKHPDGSEWQASFPFYFNSASADGSMLLTPLYARKKNADGSAAWQCFIPFVYQNAAYDAHFLTVLGGRWRMGDQENWLALPLLSGGAKDAEAGRNIWLAGLAGQQWDAEEKSHYVLPFYYSAPHKGAFVSLPYAAWERGDRKNHAIAPLLSGWYSEGEASAAVLAAGLAGYRNGSDADYSYLFPLYFASPDKGTFVSLPYAAWQRGERENRMIPPLLSGWYSEGGTSGSILAAGLAGHRSGDDKAYHYAFPFYYSARPKHKFISLPYAQWGPEDHRRYAIPLLLSGRSVEGDTSRNLLLGGMAYWQRTQGQVDGSHVLPFYLWSKDDYLYTLLYGNNRTRSYYATPLVGRYHGEGASGSWAIPLYRHKRMSSGEVNGSYLLLGYYRENEQRCEYGAYGLYDYRRYTRSGKNHAQQEWIRENKRLSYLLDLGTRSESREYLIDRPSGEKVPSAYSKEHSFFPIWDKTIKENLTDGTRMETSSLLGFLYDRRHEQSSGDEAQDYLRRRVLWRVYHHENLNGDASTDLFPAITVDSYKNGYYKFSMLWRLLRYENDPESGTKKLDILFIPLRR